MVEKKCAHPNCQCAAQQQAGSAGITQYCSSHCASQGSKTEDTCQCGHPGCKQG